MIVRYEGGGQVDTAGDLASQKSAYQILSEALPEQIILDLQGCARPRICCIISMKTIRFWR